jgi:hypothetical protein
MMTNYLIVVPRGNAELFDLLSTAFSGDDGFRVVLDRRDRDGVPVSEHVHPVNARERRSADVVPGPDEIVVAESAEPADRLDDLLVTV